ncbi:MAG: UvrD-helicase domain-containing protein [Methylocystaceae bacterium]|nr:UvrD-helicase domain-containing protein [Methylocystaceae bacterium]
MPEPQDVLNSQRGSVVAPAGCGKTHLIVDTLLASSDEKPILVLTHTTAGVAALKKRLIGNGVAKSKYRLTTIDAWAINVISMFPQRAGYIIDKLAPPDYAEIKNATNRLLASGSINDIIKATYSRLLVDEYQDCSQSQHQLVTRLAQLLPTVIFGDPMQAIFGFGQDTLPNWDNEVIPFFPVIGMLNTPWRWENRNARALGDWLLNARQGLLAGGNIDLRSCVGHIFWNRITDVVAQDLQNQVNAQYQIAQDYPDDTLLIIGDSIQVGSRHQYASRSRGVTVVERVDYPDVVQSASRMAGQTGAALFAEVIEFLKKVTVNLYSDRLIQRMDSIEAGRNRNPATEDELLAIKLRRSGGFQDAVSFMATILKTPDRRLFRHSAYSVMIEALKSAASDTSMSLDDHVAFIREKHRHAGRSVMNKAVGSTLLLKGLEADHVLILDADIPERNRRMNRKHLYVALSRGAKTITIFSRNPVLP